MKEISEFIERLKPARIQIHGNLALVPLLAPVNGEPDYLTLGQALELGVVSVTEVSESGSVSEIMVDNESKRKVLILDGEEMLGAKQKRIVNVTVLSPPESTVKIPVSCVEQGRWRYKGREFSSGGGVMPAYMRRRHQETVTFYRHHRGSFESDQNQFGPGVSSMLSDMGLKSNTDAMDDLFERFEDPIRKYLEAFNLIDCQVGTVFDLGGLIMGMECFGHQATMGEYFPRLVKSYALDAMSPDIVAKQGFSGGRGGQAKTLLEAIGNCRAEFYPSVGLGQSVRFSGSGMTGSALIEGGSLIHLCAFQGDTEKTNTGTPSMEGPSPRMRRFIH